MSTLEHRILDFCWRQDPDLAIEAGFIPRPLWESIAPKGIVEEAQQLLTEVERSSMNLYEKRSARYHLTCAAYSASKPSISLLNHMTGPAARLAWTARSWPMLSDKDGEAYIERLREFPSYCSALVKSISDQGTLHTCSSVLEAFIDQISALDDSDDHGRNLLLLPLIEARASGEAVRLPSAAVVDKVLSSLHKLMDVARYALRSTHWASPLSRLPGGKERYANAIYFGTSLHLNYNAIQELGARLLERSERRFRELLQSEASMIDYCPEIDELLSRFEATYNELYSRLSAVISSVPIMTCEVVPMPKANASVGPPAYYGPSSARNNRKGSLYVNIEKPLTTRIWETLPLSMHEGVPGHHLQLGLLDENEQIGELNRLLSVNAFTEGWAVYAETLSSNMGLEVTALDEFGLLAHKRWRASRLMVEIGLHVHGWSVAEATSFITRNTAQNEMAAKREVVRYLSWPGQALGYAVGSEAIDRWVNERTQCGESLKKSHQDLLGLGSIPLSVLIPRDREENGSFWT